MAATVELSEDWVGAGPTVADLNEWTARAIALGLSGSNVRAVLANTQGGTMLRDPEAPRAIRHLEVRGPAPELR